MEQVLIKMARQLDALDEASLLMLWERYAYKVANFEPSKRWEEAVLVLSLIQAKHWKNQLFNHSYAAHAKPENAKADIDRPFAAFNLEPKPQQPQHRATVLQFQPRQEHPVDVVPPDAQSANEAPETTDPEQN